MCFFILLEHWDEETLYGEGLTQRCGKVDSIPTEQFQLLSIIFRFLASHNPSNEQQIGSNADNSIGHQCSTEFFEFDDKNQNEKSHKVDDWIERGVLMWWGKSNPLQDNEFVIKDIDEE